MDTKLYCPKGNHHSKYIDVIKIKILENDYYGYQYCYDCKRPYFWIDCLTEEQLIERDEDGSVKSLRKEYLAKLHAERDRLIEEAKKYYDCPPRLLYIRPIIDSNASKITGLSFAINTFEKLFGNLMLEQQEIKIPNAATRAAMAEGEEIERTGNASYSTSEELFQALDKKECEHDFTNNPTLFRGEPEDMRPRKFGEYYCTKCGISKPKECEHDFEYNGRFIPRCNKCNNPRSEPKPTESQIAIDKVIEALESEVKLTEQFKSNFHDNEIWNKSAWLLAYTLNRILEKLKELNK